MRSHPTGLDCNSCLLLDMAEELEYKPPPPHTQDVTVKQGPYYFYLLCSMIQNKFFKYLSLLFHCLKVKTLLLHISAKNQDTTELFF